MQASRKVDNRLPKPTQGFEHINRYWDKQLNVPAAKILPGEIYVSKTGEIVTTVLGSCISACIRDKVTGVGGMNHFMLPASANGQDGWQGSQVSAPMRYGEWAMEFLLNEIYKHGGKKRNLEVKVFGGGKILKNMTDIGQRNILFVLEFLAREELEVVAQDLGDDCPRKVIYFSDSGRVKLKRLRSLHNNTIKEREMQYIETISKKEPSSGDIELF
ncbi:chemoreceptor glutamine deamidase CheD [Aurantivibrio plasticivorans]